MWWHYLTTFDDAQTNVKHMFNDTDLRARLLEHKLQFHQRSMNIGRGASIVYYVYAYAQPRE